MLKQSIPTIVRVALPVHLPTVFDYLCQEPVAIGSRVQVPFRKKTLIGVVTHITDKSDYKKLRTVSTVLDKSPLLNQELLNLCQWISRYYHGPIGEVFQLALPKILRQNKTIPVAAIPTIWHSLEEESKVRQQLKNAPKQWALWQFIYQHTQGVPTTLLSSFDSHWRQFAKPLVKKNLLCEKPRQATTPTPEKHHLNLEQQQVLDTINLNTFATHVLYGVTGSGKTEVYLHLIEKVLAAGKQALVLIPEISLTPQTTARFEDWFGQVVSVQHSKRSDSERYHSWEDSRTGNAKILIGTRSAIFQPFDNLGLIVVDEAHDLSFKQQDTIRYHARDLAVVRAKQLDIPVILGSATPSLENLHHAYQKHFHWQQLTQRAGKAQPAECIIDDLRQNNNHLAVSAFSLTQLRHTLDQGLQALVFINRRGFSPALHCLSCNHTETCAQCDSPLTVDKHPPHLLCHHCGTSKPLARRCPSCSEQQRVMLGVGTEKVEQQLQQLFPTHQVLRIDRDTTSKKQDWQNIYQQVNTGKADILVGTQMLAKGHHFPKVALVIILDVDQSLLSADFRATEYLGQLITQVMGRAGRAQHQGKAILQTYYPKHPVLQIVLQQGYLALGDDLLIERREANLPPFSNLALLRAECSQAENAKQFLLTARAALPNYQQLEIVGPLPAPMEKRAGKYRFVMLLQANDKKILQQCLGQWVPALYSLKTKAGLRWHIDVDPVHIH